MLKSSRAIPFANHHHVFITLQGWSKLLFTSRAIYQGCKNENTKTNRYTTELACHAPHVSAIYKLIKISFAATGLTKPQSTVPTITCRARWCMRLQ